MSRKERMLEKLFCGKTLVTDSIVCCKPSVYSTLHFTTRRHKIATSKRTYFETASNTLGSCSHRFSASTLFVLRCGRDTMKMDSAHNLPDDGHTCIAVEKVWKYNNMQGPRTEADTKPAKEGPVR